MTVSRESPITYDGTTYELPVIDAVTAAQAQETLSAHAPLSLGLDPVHESSPRTVRMLARTHASLPIPHFEHGSNGSRHNELKREDAKTALLEEETQKDNVEVKDKEVQEKVNKEEPMQPVETKKQEEQADQPSVSENIAIQGKQNKEERDLLTASSGSIKPPTPENRHNIRRSGSFLEGKKGKDFLEAIRHRRNSSMSVELPQEVHISHFKTVD